MTMLVGAVLGYDGRCHVSSVVCGVVIILAVHYVVFLSGVGIDF